MIVSLRTQLLVMGASTEIAVDNMRNAIMKMDAPTAQAVIDGDDAIDLLENQIDSSSLSILARTQPVAGDLRFVVATLRPTVVDMERIGDEASTVCGHIILMKGTSASELLDLSAGSSRQRSPGLPQVSAHPARGRCRRGAGDASEL